MRWAAFVFAVAAGCQFAVQGTDVPAAGGDPGGGAPAPTGPAGGTPAPPSGPTGSTTPPTASPDLAVTPGPDMALAPVGAPCTADAACATGFCGHSGGFLSVPGGYCTLDCAGPKANSCPMGSSCQHLTNVGDYCLSNCPPDPCRTGYKCCDLGKSGGAKTCAPNAFCD